METKKNVSGNRFNAKSFKIVYIIIFVFILITDVIVIILLFSIWANLEVLSILKINIFLWLYYLFLFSPIVKVGFEIYELIRFSKFSRSTQQDKEHAMRVARGFRGTRIYRIYYIIIIMVLIVWMEIEEYLLLLPFVHAPGESEYLSFYFWFSILLYIHILPLIIGPQIIKFSIDPTDRGNKIKMIVYTTVWAIVLLIPLNLNIIMLLFALAL